MRLVTQLVKRISVRIGDNMEIPIEEYILTEYEKELTDEEIKDIINRMEDEQEPFSEN